MLANTVLVAHVTANGEELHDLDDGKMEDDRLEIIKQAYKDQGLQEYEAEYII
ncbi:hypothetical protein EC973_001036, partial [Apophysomyces ossiformis]